MQILSYVITGIAALMVTLSGIMKLSRKPEIVAGLTKMGVGAFLPVLGIMEILFTVLFLVPLTMKIGFLFLTAYFAGAMATDLSHGSPIKNSTMVLVLIWIAAFLRDPPVFY